MAQQVELTLAPRPESVAESRRAVSGALSGLTEHTQDAVKVIVSELVTNALKHGPEQPIALRLWRDGATVRGEVEDEGDGDLEIWKEADRGSRGGFGLPIVEAMSDSWGYSSDGNAVVWFELSQR